MVVLEIAGNRSAGMMRAISDIVDDGALSGELGAHPVVQRAQIVLRKESARHAGLIGEEEHKISGIVQAADRLRRIRHPANPVLRSHKAVVMVDDAVAIEERGGLWRGTGRIDTAHFLKPSVNTRLMAATTSDAGMSRMQRWSFMVQTGRWQGWQGTTVLVCTVAASPFRGAQ